MRRNTSRSDASSLSTYYRDVARLPMLSAEAENEVATRFRRTGDRREANRLVQANLRFVVKIAREYENYGFPILDLVQEGNLGLLQAVDHFDPTRGFRLISYGVWWIRAAVQEYILRNWSLVKLGTTQLQRRLFSTLQSSKKQLQRLLAAETEEERVRLLATEVGGTIEDVQDMQRRISGRDASLNAPSNPHRPAGITGMDRLGADSTDVEAIVAQEELRQLLSDRLAAGIAELPDREQVIIARRHLAHDPETLSTLGARFGVSKERIRQLEERALRLLRASLASQGSTTAG
jgi:RNA polymerase sigma-32 factor